MLHSLPAGFSSVALGHCNAAFRAWKEKRENCVLTENRVLEVNLLKWSNKFLICTKNDGEDSQSPSGFFTAVWSFQFVSAPGNQSQKKNKLQSQT